VSIQKPSQSRRSVETEMRKVRKQLKKNRKPKRPRHRDWVPGSIDDEMLYELDHAESEPVMPRGEREHRQAVQQAALAALSSEAEEDVEVPAPDRVSGQPCMVIEVGKGMCLVALERGELLCRLRGSLSAQDTGYTNVVAVGDRVVVSEDGSGEGVVETVLPRRTALARPDRFQDGYRLRDRHLQQVIVANVDQLLIVASWREPKLWPELIDRYLISGERNGLVPIICVNKIDLADDVADCRAQLQPYTDVGYRVILTSASEGVGIAELKEVLRGQTTVLAGMSGVGKSSLLNAVQPGLRIHTQEISEYHQTGRHTTTQVSMMELEMGGYVVDTPGIREFGLSGLQRKDLAAFYPEIAALNGACRFKDCTHTHEPGCMIKIAVEDGRVSPARYQSYRSILESLPD
jgi:ribosome biogenesis GTPase